MMSTSDIENLKFLNAGEKKALSTLADHYEFQDIQNLCNEAAKDDDFQSKNQNFTIYDPLCKRCDLFVDRFRLRHFNVSKRHTFIIGGLLFFSQLLLFNYPMHGRTLLDASQSFSLFHLTL